MIASKNKMIPIAAVTWFGSKQPDRPPLPVPLSFRWHVVTQEPVNLRAREILLSDAAAVVLFVGADDAVDQAVDLLHRLRSTGSPVLLAVAEAPDAQTERLLRQTGAVYLCGREACQRLSDLLQQMLGPPDTT